MVTAFVSNQAFAEGYPEKPVTIISGSTPGGGGDFTTRLVAKELSKIWGQPVVVENQPGASQSIAAGNVATAAPDGYTLLFVTSSILAIKMRDDVPFDLEKDLSAIKLVATSPVLLAVKADLPAKDVKELVALAKSDPGKLSYGSSGVGSAGHLAGEVFKSMAGVDINHVPYKGGAEAVVALASGEVDISYPGIAGTQALVDSGKIRVLAVSSKDRLSSMPDVVTIDEAGVPGYDYKAWYGMFAPSGIPEDVKKKLVDSMQEVVKSEEVQKALKDQGLEPQPASTAEDFTNTVHTDLIQYVDIAKKIGLTAN
ncbi:MAG: tripartite tricarboxylate transporter substrate binding protein [Rhizobiaceae bacterium]|nr:tripartite tricarboxylate transporter substrate binding protein [Rhizobiaceae bacterium]